MVIIDEKGEEETPNHSKTYDTIQSFPAHFEPLSSSPNEPPYPNRVIVEKKDPIPKFNLASELRNLFIRVPLLQASKEIPICTKIIRELYLKKKERKRVER